MKRKWKGLFLFATGIMAMLALTGCGKTKINLNDYVQVTFSGYDTVGNAETNVVTFKEDIIFDNWEVFGLTEEEKDNRWYTTNPDAYQFADNISFSLDKTTGLSNGDTVVVKWKVYGNNIAEIEEKLKVEFEYSDMEITVEGLEEAQPWDAFENIKITYAGLEPLGEVSPVNIASSEIPDLYYSPNKHEGLSNGDIITVRLYVPNHQDVTAYCMSYGKIPTAVSKEFVVEGLDGYVTNLSQIPEDMLQKMDENIRSKVAAEAAATWAWKLSEMELLGNYFLVSNEEFYYTSNLLYYIYRITELNESTGETVSYYYYGAYQDVMLLGDGTISVDLDDVDFPEGGVDYMSRVYGEAFTLVRGGQHFVGYEDLETLFNKHVAEKEHAYTYTSTVTQ